MLILPLRHWVSKLFRAYGLYNSVEMRAHSHNTNAFQSSFELTGYITILPMYNVIMKIQFQSSFELTGYITNGSSGC